MSKKFNKIFLGLAAVGAGAAGIYYLLKKAEEAELEDEFDDDFDFEDDFELDEDLKETPQRGYTTLNPSPEKAAEAEAASDQGTEEAPKEASVPEKEAAPSKETDPKTEESSAEE